MAKLCVTARARHLSIIFKSFYNQLIVNNLNFPFKCMWKVKVPPKIKVFVWLIMRNSILTKDNLLRRGWSGDANCVFCGKEESVDHLFLNCSVAKFLWGILQTCFGFGALPDNMKTLWTDWISRFGKEKRKKLCVGIFALLWSIWTCRNDICFERRRIIDPFVILYKTYQLIESWSILQKNEESLKEMKWAVKLLERVTSEVFHASKEWRPGVLRIEGGWSWRLSWLAGIFILSWGWRETEACGLRSGSLVTFVYAFSFLLVVAGRLKTCGDVDQVVRELARFGLAGRCSFLLSFQGR